MKYRWKCNFLILSESASLNYLRFLYTTSTTQHLWRNKLIFSFMWSPRSCDLLVHVISSFMWSPRSCDLLVHVILVHVILVHVILVHVISSFMWSRSCDLLMWSRSCDLVQVILTFLTFHSSDIFGKWLYLLMPFYYRYNCLHMQSLVGIVWKTN